MLATDMLAKQSNLALIWATNKIYFRIRFFGKLIFYVEILVVSGILQILKFENSRQENKNKTLQFGIRRFWIGAR